MRKNKKKEIIKKIGFIVLSIILAIGLFLTYEHYKKATTIPSVDKLIKEKQKNNFPDETEKPIDSTKYENPLPAAREYYQNNDIMGKLEIPNLNIDAWITRASNNEYYLNNSLSHQRDELGVPFFDYRNISLNTDRQINIYGHNTTNEKYFNQLPFINLEAYTNKDIYDHYKDIYLSIDERQIHYEIIAIKIITGNDNEHMKIIFYSDEDYLRHTAKLLQNTLYRDSSIGVSAEDRLIVLQVCHYNPPNTYLLVIGKEVK